MNIEYHWIGGSTGSTLADRFDWNVAENWRTVTYDTPWSEPTIEVATDVPSWGDTVYIGSLFSSSKQDPRPKCIMATSPLLFGGFSGDVNNGGWTAGSYSNTGTTWTSALRLVAIEGYASSDFSTPGNTFSYPFSVIGGGVKQNILYYNDVEGMTVSNWTYLSYNSTARQRQLKLKSNYYSVGVDGTVNKVRWTSNYGSVNPQGVTTAGREIYIEAMDTYTSPGEAGNLSFLIFQSLNTKLTLTNSKLQQLLYSNSVMTNPTVPYDANSWERDWRNQDRNWIYLKNSTIEDVQLLNWVNVTIDNNCLIGTINMNSDFWAKSWINVPTSFWAEGPNMYLGGTYSPEKAAKAMRPSPNLSGLSLINGIDIQLRGLTFRNSYGDYTSQNVYVYLGDKGITLNAERIKICGSDGYGRAGDDLTDMAGWWTNDKRIKAVIGPAVINQIEISKGIVYTVWSDNAKDIRIRSFYLTNESTLDLSKSPQFTNWKFGEITNTNYSGGLYCSPATRFDSQGYSIDHSVVLGNNNQNFINYAIMGDRNTRSGVRYTGTEQYIYIPPGV